MGDQINVAVQWPKNRTVRIRFVIQPLVEEGIRALRRKVNVDPLDLEDPAALVKFLADTTRAEKNRGTVEVTCLDDDVSDLLGLLNQTDHRPDPITDPMHELITVVLPPNA